MVAVDTNILIRLITGEPEGQAAEARHCYTEAKIRSLAVDRVILAECLYALRSNYRFTKPETLDLLSDLLKSKTFTFMDEEICSRMLSIMQSSNLSPEDACLAALVRTGIAETVSTFDVDLLKYLSKTLETYLRMFS